MSRTTCEDDIEYSQLVVAHLGDKIAAESDPSPEDLQLFAAHLDQLDS